MTEKQLHFDAYYVDGDLHGQVGYCSHTGNVDFDSDGSIIDWNVRLSGQSITIPK